MKILLVKPPFARLLDNDAYLTYPLGLMCVASMLKSRGHEVRIYHDDVSNPHLLPTRKPDIKPISFKPIDADCLTAYIETLNTFDPDIVGFSFCTVDAEAAYVMAEFARQRMMRTVAGGVHPSLLPGEQGLFDAVVVGEGDTEEAATAFEDPDTVIVNCPPQEDLDLFPADRDCTIRGELHDPYLKGMIQTQRGCPHSCSYCAAPKVFGSRVRVRDPGAVREEVEAISQPHGRIIDDSFGARMGHALRVCTELEKVSYQWVCDAALQNVDERLAYAMKAGGCGQVNVGVESASERWRALSGKKVAPGEPERVLGICQNAGMKTVFYYIIGYPGETLDELRGTLDHAKHMKEIGAKPCISVLTPYPGTRMWDLCSERLFFNSWSEFIHQSSDMGFADVTHDEWQAILDVANELNV